MLFSLLHFARIFHCSKMRTQYCNLNSEKLDEIAALGTPSEKHNCSKIKFSAICLQFLELFMANSAFTHHR